MPGLSAREKRLALAAAAAVAALVFFEGAMRPFLSSWRSLREDADEAEAKVANARHLIDNAPQIEAEHRLLALTPPGRRPEDDMGAFLQAVETLARRNLLTISDLRPLPMTLMKTHRLYRVELETRGDLPRLATFLYGAEILSPSWRVERFSASSAPDGVLAKLEISKLALGGAPRPSSPRLRPAPDPSPEP